MNFKTNLITLALLFICISSGKAQMNVNEVRPPIMGWASWNNYRVGINENIIRSQVDAMTTNGMKEVGYSYVNTDDGFFDGRDENGNLMYNKERFPHGMKALVNYINSKGLKAGIYSDAGINTCGSVYDQDTISVGCGLYGHDYQDLKRYLLEWGYDFIKVDWCGGDRMKLDEQTRYTEISRIIHELKPSTVFNVCRWAFPGKWVTQIADSWRISADIEDKFESICNIIDLNADLWPYCEPGHYNDMDMLQVGRGMTYEEDKAHFSMWCMMVSPLLAGNDLTQMSEETLSILTNREMIAINQDPLFYQARRIEDLGDLEIWAKPLRHTMSGEIAVALLNRSEDEANITFNLNKLGLDASKGYVLRDLWNKKEYQTSTLHQRTFSVPRHGVVILRIKGKSMPFNVYQKE